MLFASLVPFILVTIILAIVLVSGVCSAKWLFGSVVAG